MAQPERFHQMTAEEYIESERKPGMNVSQLESRTLIL
jgi:hypothetical protein